MITVNEHYAKLQSSYLFSTIAKKVQDYSTKNPDAQIIKLGIGDVTRALPQACITAFHAAIDEMAADQSFKGYGPEQGYGFLREAIARHDFTDRGVSIDPTDVFISDGAKCDTGNIQELFSAGIRVAVPDPVYPVYVDTNVMAGRTGFFTDGRYEHLVYLDSTEENNFLPGLPHSPVDLIYLCFPNNPTGQTATKEELKKWVDYAHEHKALILFDAAYEAFIRNDELPHSIFEIPGAKEVAIEFRSFSKTAGFTGTRCAYTIVPEECRAFNKDGEVVHLKPLWNRRHTTKFNGVSYPVQRAAEAVFSSDGQKQVKELIDFYLENARIIRERMSVLGFSCTGGDNSPYIWIKTGQDSWSFFDLLLASAHVVCTPGSGFGSCGEGFIRISAFNSRENVNAAMDRISGVL